MLVALVAVVLVLGAQPARAIAPVKHSHLQKPDRVKWCGKDADCVIVKEHGAGAVFRVDDLDLMADTTDVLLQKLPPWFGPRPARLVHDHRVLVPHKPLAQQGVDVMHSIIIYKAPLDEEEDEAATEVDL